MKIFILPGVLAVAGLSVSCVHQVRTSGVYAAPAAEKTRQVPAFERQVANARDAGEGDYVVRRLRQQMAAEPDNESKVVISISSARSRAAMDAESSVPESLLLG